MRGAASDRRALWHAKPALRAIYGDYHRRIVAWCHPGPTLEVGSGIGSLKDRLPDVITTDITPEPWLDAAADAQALPFRDHAFTNLVLVDVIHHLEFPRRFLSEAVRVLRPGGRLIMLEPAITPASYVFYRLFHDEPVDMAADPLAEGRPNRRRDPSDANQAIPTLLFGRYRQTFDHLYPRLKLRHLGHLSLIAYPLSGGFRTWSLIPAAAAELCLRVERRVEPSLGRWLGFRLLAVCDRI